MADIITNSAQLRLGSGFLAWNENTVQACLYNSSATFTATSEAYTTTNELASGNGYTRLGSPGMTVSGKTVSLDAVNNHVVYDCNDLTWTATGGDIGPARYCAFVDTLSGVNKYIYIIDFAADKTANTGTDFKITIDTSGLFRSRQG